LHPAGYLWVDIGRSRALAAQVVEIGSALPP
jgi:hypothetical protein